MSPVTIFLVVILTAILVVGIVFARKYFNRKGKMLATCPETHKAVSVEVNPRLAALSSLLGGEKLEIKACTRWPERQDCGQECLSEIENAPENCLVRNILTRWFEGKQCVYCRKPFEAVHWHDHKPALRNPEGELLEWPELTVENLQEILQTHQPVCWNCLIAEDFRRKFPDLVTDRSVRRNDEVA